MEFGKKMGIVEPQEFMRMERMSLEIQQNGPGGCQTPQECKIFCDNLENMEECVKFSEKMGLMKPAEAKVIRMLGPEGQGGPGGCQGKEECKKYCMDPEHTEECLDFFLEQEIMMPQDADKMREMREMTPPPMEQNMQMMPYDIENMPIEKLMELIPPEIKEKLKDLPPEKIKEALMTFKLETMLTPERDVRDARDAPTMDQGIPMEFLREYDEKMRMQTQTQMFQQDRMPMIMPENMMPNDVMLPEKYEIRVMPPDIDNVSIEKLMELMPQEIKEKMQMIMQDNITPQQEMIIDNRIIEREMPMMQMDSSEQNFYDKGLMEPMQPMEFIQPEPEPQTFFNNVKLFLANITSLLINN